MPTAEASLTTSRLKLNPGALGSTVEFEQAFTEPHGPLLLYLAMSALCRILKGRGRPIGWVGLIYGAIWLTCATAPATSAQLSPPALALKESELASNLIITNCQQVRDCAQFRIPTTLPVRLEGVARYAAPSGLVLLSDTSGLAAVEFDLKRNPLCIGQRVHVAGWGRFGGGHALFYPGPVVNNDGSHAEQQSAGRRFLQAGYHSLRVVYYQAAPPFALAVRYQGPGFESRIIPPDVLFHMTRTEAGGPAYAAGLEYKYAEGWWNAAPDFSELTLLKTGIVPDFSLAPRQREENYAFEFTGRLKIEREGVYTFELSSDDGSLLFIGEETLRVETEGPAQAWSPDELGPPQAIHIGQLLPPEQDYIWSAAEGIVSFASPAGPGWELELESDSGRLRVLVADSRGGDLALLRRSRVRALGFCVGGHTLDGDRVAGALLVPGLSNLDLLETSTERWNAYPVTTIASFAGAEPDQVRRARGTVSQVVPGRGMAVEDGSGRVWVGLTRPLPPIGTQVEVLGLLCLCSNRMALQHGLYRELTLVSTNSSERLPVLTTAEQVRQLKPEEAERAYPVRLRGVITDRHMESRAVIQDSTSAIYLGSFPAESWRAPVGHLCEIEGVSNPGGFAPTVFATKITDLGPGRFPEPIQATYEQLSSGSLDCQWVELEGMVRRIAVGQFQLAVRGGQVGVDIIDRREVAALNNLSNAFVRVRGCAVPWFNEARQVIGGVLLRVPSAAFITVDALPPREPFALPSRRATQLLEFDPHKSQLQWVKVTGQLVLATEGWACLMDGPTNGLRFFPREHTPMVVGDLIEVVGVPELGGPSPLLRQAVVRSTGRAPLPPAPAQQVEQILQGRCDSTRVELQGRLVNTRFNHRDLTLEIQSGLRTFEAHLPDNSLFHGLPPLGSQVALVGVVVSRRRAESGMVDSFGLWLNSGADLRCLELPPRWTLKQALVLISVLATAVLLAALWITLLRRRVEQRTRQLRTEMEERREAEARVTNLELLRALEAERARISRNIHDDLGARATRLSRLVNALRARVKDNGETNRHLEDISLVSRQMVQALDETVWTVNPTNDSVARLADYITHFADEFFHGTGIRCQLQIPLDLPEKPLTTECRHGLFLVVKEALNNVLKHAHAHLVTLTMSLEGARLQLTISDDGSGFLPDNSSAGNGLGNMRERVRGLGGHITVEGLPGRGTTIRLEVPILDAPVATAV